MVNLWLGKKLNNHEKTKTKKQEHYGKFVAWEKTKQPSKDKKQDFDDYVLNISSIRNGIS